MKRETHIASLKTMIRQNEKDLARMKQLLHELDSDHEQSKGKTRRKKARRKQE